MTEPNRSRADNSNDEHWVAQKNGMLVRLVSLEAAQVLGHRWALSLFANLLQPSFKLKRADDVVDLLDKDVIR